MDGMVSQILTTQSAYLAASVVIITFFVRRIVETAVPSVKKKADENEVGLTYETPFARWWNQVLLYLVPVVAGSLVSVLKVPYLSPAEIDGASAVFYGGIIGWFSSFLYKVVRISLKKKTGLDISPTDSIPSPAKASDPAEFDVDVELPDIPKDPGLPKDVVDEMTKDPEEDK